TFTDLVGDDGRVVKVPSTPDDLTRALRTALDGAGVAASAELLAHGTTVATNALLEGRGGRVALMSTRGPTDVIEVPRPRRTPPPRCGTPPGRPPPPHRPGGRPPPRRGRGAPCASGSGAGSPAAAVRSGGSTPRRSLPSPPAWTRWPCASCTPTSIPRTSRSSPRSS